MADVKLLMRGRVSAPKAPLDDERAKVMLSIGQDQLKRIDARADAAHMTRSAYIVEMTLRDDVGLLSAMTTLQNELRRFTADNAGWKGEVAALRRQVEKQDKAISAALALARNTVSDIEQKNRAGESVSSATMIRLLKTFIQALEL